MKTRYSYFLQENDFKALSAVAKEFGFTVEDWHLVDKGYNVAFLDIDRNVLGTCMEGSLYAKARRLPFTDFVQKMYGKTRSLVIGEYKVKISKEEIKFGCTTLDKSQVEEIISAWREVNE